VVVARCGAFGPGGAGGGGDGPGGQAVTRRSITRLGDPGVLAQATGYVLVYATAATMALPFVWMVLTSLKTSAEATEPPSLGTLLPADPQWSNYAEAVRAASLGDFYWMSTSVAVVTTVLAVLHNALAGYAFAKLRFAGKRVLLGVTLVTMMLPVQVFFVFAYVLCDWLDYVDRFAGLVVPFLASGFGVFYMRQVMVNVPDSLIEASRMDGLGEFSVFWTIVRPVAWPGFAALAIFTFMNSWNSFFWPLVIVDSPAKKTLPLAIADLAAGDYVQSWPVIMAAGCILVLPLVLVFFLLQRAFIEGMALTGSKEG
jgi:multiple sugar transport system permease protein